MRTSLMPTSGSGASTSQSPGRASDFASAFTPPSPSRLPWKPHELLSVIATLGA